MHRNHSHHVDSGFKKYLYVILHGLFVVHFRRDHIQLFSPYVPEHMYLAGNSNIYDLKPLERGEIYSLVGVRSSYNPPPIPHDCNVAIDRSQIAYSIKSSASQFLINLPFPFAISPARCLRGYHFFAGQSAAILNPNGIALCQVLTYLVGDFNDVRLWGTDWKPKVKDYPNRKYSVAKLHLWAEPDMVMDHGHTGRAYRALMDLVPPIDLEPLIEIVPLPKDTGIIGLFPEDLKGLAEWYGVVKPIRRPPIDFKSIAQSALDKDDLRTLLEWVRPGYSSTPSSSQMYNHSIAQYSGITTTASSSAGHGTRSSNCQSIIVTNSRSK
jgi:hypothetical protein